ncbi:MAG: Trk system potassium transporter TrkA [Gemmatimonadetes bacterium]|nr:Trk system potassium transporter TrkA [Gemmatimonadota bacterium]MBT5142904.1 Trk system potassium transporter TrkA [Gemmatimonadota bacterium]MBT5589498.1 Trk system potassium transporter TrkA [Gemmatimonadota bacterium]MBT5959961.1 Trk system potassium transporter TrkA [Gemmatimonadota bacterium]MBT6629339.1 Trk system potassium transporter TrkA [Gemmatimonadota bacterium]
MKRSENILVIGLGSMGTYLVRRLTHEGHHVTVIEGDAKILAEADATLDARLILGDAADFGCWGRIDAAKMDYMIAVTNDDALNILAAQIADRYGIRQKIARIRSVEVWAKNAPLTAADLKIDLVIRPGELAAREVARLLKMQDGSGAVAVGDGELRVVNATIGPDSLLANVSLSQLADAYDDLPFRVVCVERDIVTHIPGGDFEIRPGDRVHLIARKDQIAQLMLFAPVPPNAGDQVLIIGGGLIGARIAELLQSTYSVRLLEEDEARAEELASVLEKTECLHGDGLDRETLLQAGLMNMNTVIVATGDNEANIMTSVLAKHMMQTGTEVSRPGRTITLVKKEDYVGIASALGTDMVLSAQILGANAVLRHIRSDYVLNVAHLHGCDAEMVQLIANPGSPITKRPLHSIPDMAGRIMISGVRTDGRWDIARGVTQIREGDHVECVCSFDGLAELQRLFFA